MLNDCQRGANRSNTPNEISCCCRLVRWLQRRFRGLELCFYGGMPAAKNSAVAYVTHNAGRASSTLVGSDSSHFRTGAPAPRNCSGTPRAFNQALRAFDVIGSRGMMKGLNFQSMLLVPLAGATV